MKIDKVLNGNLDEQTFFGERDKAFLLASAPDSKLSLNLNYNRKWFDAGLTFTRFSEIKLLDFFLTLKYFVLFEAFAHLLQASSA